MSHLTATGCAAYTMHENVRARLRTRLAHNSHTREVRVTPHKIKHAVKVYTACMHTRSVYDANTHACRRMQTDTNTGM